MLPTPKKTKQKFYNQYIYKINLEMLGAFALRHYKFDHFKNSGNLPFKSQFEFGSERLSDKVNSNKENLLKLSFMLESYKDSMRIRVEGDWVDIYTNQDTIYHEFLKEFESNVIRRWEPPAGLEDELLDSHKKIFVKKLPHEKYEYKVYLLPHKLKYDRDSIADWYEKQTEHTSISPSIVKWIRRTSQNWDRRYILVDNDKTLLMLKLRSPELIGAVHRYVVIT